LRNGWRGTLSSNSQVELVGTVNEGVGYDANNKREEYYFLSLEKAISVAGDDDPEEKHIEKIQLVL